MLCHDIFRSQQRSLVMCPARKGRRSHVRSEGALKASLGPLQMFYAVY